jgi:hypothetical protein
MLNVRGELTKNLILPYGWTVLPVLKLVLFLRFLPAINDKTINACFH